ncbi:putative oxidoreductase [Rhodococcus ruber]|uniref:SDR family oxidoreductase n=1 Tax=Rhodococcus ruber TaxID=1830 RepID=UPI00315CBA7C
MNFINNKVVIVTGASSGIGAATAKAIAKRGARVVAAALDDSGLRAVVAEIEAEGGTAISLVTDVTDPQSAQALIDYAVECFDTVDVLINNAGLMFFSQWKDLALDEWNQMIDVNIRGYLHTIHAVLPIMLKQGSGHIVNMASLAGHVAHEGAGVYSATKFFVAAMTDGLRKELSVRDGIRATAISPGVINTGWPAKLSDPEARKSAEELAKVAIEPESVASAVLYAVDQPDEVTINDLLVSPTRQPW